MAAVCRACWTATSSKMEYTENTVICNCKHVTLADIDNALQRSAHFSDVEKEFAEVQKLTSCSTGCGGSSDLKFTIRSWQSSPSGSAAENKGEFEHEIRLRYLRLRL